MKRRLVAAILTVAALAVLSAPTEAQTEAALAQATSVDSGDDHTCARLSTGQVRCWGENAPANWATTPLSTVARR